MAGGSQTAEFEAKSTEICRYGTILTAKRMRDRAALTRLLSAQVAIAVSANT
jgi:hypothetical protein